MSIKDNIHAIANASKEKLLELKEKGQPYLDQAAEALGVDKLERAMDRFQENYPDVHNALEHLGREGVRHAANAHGLPDILGGLEVVSKKAGLALEDGHEASVQDYVKDNVVGLTQE